MNTKTMLAGKILFATALVMFGTSAAGAAVYAFFGDIWGQSPEPADLFLPMLLSSFLLVIAVLAPARMSTLARWPRIAALFTACLGVNVLLMQIEAAAFLDMSGVQLAASLTQATLAAAWLCLVCGLLFGARESAAFADPERPAVRSVLGRLLIAAVAYLLLYLVAGMLIYPMVQDWYELQGFEAGPWIVPLALMRGACYAVFSLWLIRSMRCTRLQCAFVIAVMFPILAGLAALVIPTEIMPPHVRGWHALEIGWSNFAFGFLVGWLFWRRQ